MSSAIRATGLVALLLGVGVAALALADGAWKTVTQYRSPYRSEAVLPAGEALSERVVLIVLDGVRVDAAEAMASVQALQRRGVDGVLETELPSLSRPARATLVTGARPEVHGVMTNGRHEPPPIPSLFSLARQHGVRTAVAGDSSWVRAFPDMIDEVREFDKELPTSTTADAAPIVEWQNAICDGTVPFLRGVDSGLLVAGVTAPDAAGHDFGGESDIYKEVVQAADACVGRLVEALDDGRTTFVVVSDHGHIQRRGHGGHGGTEEVVRRTPFVATGPGVADTGLRPAEGFQGRHVDVAPTLAVLLGLPLPALAEGRPIAALLDLRPQQHAELAARVVQQQRIRLQTLPDPAESAAAERAGRLPVGGAAGLAVAALGVWAAMQIAGSWRRRLVAVSLFVGVYAVSFWMLGLGYSLSAVVKEEYLNLFFAKNIAAAAMGFAAAALWLRRDLLWLGLSLQCVLALRVVWSYADSGLFLQTYLPDLDVSFRTYLDLLAIFAVGATACVAAGLRRLLAAKA